MVDKLLQHLQDLLVAQNAREMNKKSEAGDVARTGCHVFEGVTMGFLHRSLRCMKLFAYTTVCDRIEISAATHVQVDACTIKFA